NANFCPAWGMSLRSGRSPRARGAAPWPAGTAAQPTPVTPGAPGSAPSRTAGVWPGAEAGGGAAGGLRIAAPRWMASSNRCASDLLQVVQRGNACAPGFGLGQSGQEHARKNRSHRRRNEPGNRALPAASNRGQDECGEDAEHDESEHESFGIEPKIAVDRVEF